MYHQQKKKNSHKTLFFAHHFIVYELNLDVPEGEQPPPATNLTLTQEAGGWVLRWEPPKDENKSSVLYYSIQKKKDTQGEEWKNLAEYIDVDEASFMSKSNIYSVLPTMINSYPNLQIAKKCDITRHSAVISGSFCHSDFTSNQFLEYLEVLRLSFLQFHGL